MNERSDLIGAGTRVAGDDGPSQTKTGNKRHGENCHVTKKLSQKQLPTRQRISQQEH